MTFTRLQSWFRPGLAFVGWLASGLACCPQTLFYASSSATQGDNAVAHITSAGSANVYAFFATGSIGNGGNGVLRCSAIALDPGLQKVFLADAGNSAIWSLNLNGTGLSLVKSNLTATPTDLALDTLNQKIYFTTSSATQTNNTIQRVDYSGGNNVVLFTATGQPSVPVQRCTALALDLPHAAIFFSDAGARALWSVSLAGSGLNLVRSNLTAAPLGLALDVVNQLVYYVTSDTVQGNNTVQRVGYAGGGNALLFTAGGSTGNGVQRCSALALDPTGSRIFLSDIGSSSLWSLDLNGADLYPVWSGIVGAPRRVRSLPLVSQFTVVNLNDSGPGSLRDAIQSITFSGQIDFSNSLFATSSGVISLSTVGDNTFGPSALVVTNQVIINGPTGTNGIVLTRSNGAPAMRLFFVQQQGTLSLRNLTLTNGLAQGGVGGSGSQRGGSGGGAGGMGGAIFNWGALDLANTTLAANTAWGGAGGGGYLGHGLGSGGGGGGMQGDGEVGGNSTIGGVGGEPLGGIGGSDTTAATPGGIGGGGGGGGSSSVAGLGSGAGGRGGFAGGGGGGGAYNTEGFGGGIGGAGGGGGFGGGGGGPGSGTPSGVVGQPGFGGGGGGLADNSGNVGSAGGGGAGLGGGIFSVYGALTVTNCTFSGNAAIGGPGGVMYSSAGTNGQGLGGGIFCVDTAISVVNSTFAYNRAEAGGGICNLGYAGPSTVLLRNTILAYTPAGVSDFAAASAAGGSTTNVGSNNLIQTNDGFAGGIVTSADPRIGPLANNGGPTLTHAPLNGSPAINAGDNAGLPPTDQRGYARIADALGTGSLVADIGAVEDGLVRLRTVPQTAQSIALNGFQLFLTGESNRFYVIQSSTNLTSWGNLSTNQVPATELLILDSTAGPARQNFYRAHSLP